MLKKGLNFSTVPSISAFVSLSFAFSKNPLIFLFKFKANSSLSKYPLISYLIPSFFIFFYFFYPWYHPHFSLHIKNLLNYYIS
jgi:hypothetical protein